MSLQIEYVPLGALVRHEANPKAHDIDLVVASVRRFGFVDPVVIDERTGKLAAGHGRLTALERMRDHGDDPPAGIRREKGDWLVPQVTGWASASDSELDAALVALNRTTEAGGWDDRALLDILDRLLEGVGVGALLTDPPYGISVVRGNGVVGATDRLSGGKGTLYAESAHGPTRALVQKAANVYANVAGDDRPFDATLLSDHFAEVVEQWWFGANYYRSTLPGTDLDGSWLVWDKRPSGWNEGSEGLDDVIGSGFELVWSKRPHQQRVLRHQWSGFTARNHGNRDAGVLGHERAHPTEKPIALLVQILDLWAPRRQAVVDPFAGSGTTLLAAHRTGRPGFGVELSPAYCDVIVARLARESGQPGIHADTGQPFVDRTEVAVEAG